jgi:predicted dehydrogenase
VKQSEKPNLTRRDVLKAAGGAAAAAALAGIAVPSVFAGEDNTIRVALVGCGGRGGGAVENALKAKGGPTKLVAMADVFQDKLDDKYKWFQGQEFAKQAQVPEDHRFTGFDAYQKAMDCLRPGDVVILTTPPAFRWVHFTYAISKGLNIFMEKPVSVDGPSSKRMFKLAEEATKKNLKVGVGLMCRHCPVRGELYKKIRNGDIGDLMLLRAARMKGPEATCFSEKRPDNVNELEYQIRRFHSFLWASGGCYSDFLIHNIDECCWMKDDFPIKAQATGGRHYRDYQGKPQIDQNFDHYSVEYTFKDGARLLLEGRTMPDCAQDFSSHAWGTKGSAVISTASHFPAKSRTFKGWNFAKDDVTWDWDQAHGMKDESDPYQIEWDDLLEAIRADKPYNEVPRGAEASLVTAMGRMAAHTGEIITRDDILNCEYEFAPNVDKLVLNGPAPVQAGKDGRYPVPEPGRLKDPAKPKEKAPEYRLA